MRVGRKKKKTLHNKTQITEYSEPVSQGEKLQDLTYIHMYRKHPFYKLLW